MVDESGATFTLANGVESVVLGDTTYMLVDQADTTLGNHGGFHSLQAAIDASQNGDKILVAPGTYTEHANYNPNHRPFGRSELHQSAWLAGRQERHYRRRGWARQRHHQCGEHAGDIVASIESDWGTNFYITAPNVTITGLDFEGTDVAYGQGNQGHRQQGDRNRRQQRHIGERRYRRAAPGVPVGSSVYVDELTRAEQPDGLRRRHQRASTSRTTSSPAILSKQAASATAMPPPTCS